MKPKSYKTWPRCSLGLRCCILIKLQNNCIAKYWYMICVSPHRNLVPSCTGLLCAPGQIQKLAGRSSCHCWKKKMVPVRLSLKYQRDYSVGTEISCSHRGYIYTVRGGYNHHVCHIFTCAGCAGSGKCQDEQPYGSNSLQPYGKKLFMAHQLELS